MSEHEVAAAACPLARQATGAERTAFVSRDGDDVVYLHEDAAVPRWLGRRVPLGACASGRAIQQARSRIDREDDHPCVIVPIAGARAALAAYWDPTGNPGARELQLLEGIASFAALTLEKDAVSRAKDEFLAGLGHELRNPLAPIVTVLSLVKLRGHNAFDREWAIIDRQAHHLVRLVDDLLDVSRISRGAIQLRRAPVELAWVVARALDVTSTLIAERGHRVAVNVPASGLSIDADVDRFTQVIANLLTNASRHTPRGGLITVVGDLEGTCARLVVRDSGIGIEPQVLPRLFELFGPNRRLSIVRSIVELHGGVVSAASEGPGRGAAFTVRVPIGSADEHDGLGHELVRDARPIRVLVVDDNIDAAETLGELLSVMGHDPVVVHDGPAALETVETFKPEIAFLDIGLPVIDGYELASRLRAMPGLSDAPLVAVTGFGQAADRQRARLAGFDEHLVKPLSAEKLRVVLGKLVA